MTNNASTVRVQVDLPFARNGEAGRGTTTGYPWSGAVGARVMANLNRPPTDPVDERSAAANTDSDPTGTPQAIEVPDLEARVPPQPQLGKRAFVPSYQWEGVVEEVTEEGFVGRLVPYEDGKPDPSRVEYGDFSFDDLSDDADVDLVENGAVFYWTVGRARDDWGTIKKSSLVRFRRLPTPTSYMSNLAATEAAALLEDLRDRRSS